MRGKIHAEFGPSVTWCGKFKMALRWTSLRPKVTCKHCLRALELNAR